MINWVFFSKWISASLKNCSGCILKFLILFWNKFHETFCNWHLYCKLKNPDILRAPMSILFLIFLFYTSTRPPILFFQFPSKVIVFWLSTGKESLFSWNAMVVLLQYDCGWIYGHRLVSIYVMRFSIDIRVYSREIFISIFWSCF